MGRKCICMAVSVLFITGIFLVIHTDSSAVSCRDECYQSCCGDEGICNGEDEEACVSDCLKECDDNVPVVTAPEPSGDGDSADEGGNGSDAGDTDNN